MLVIASVTEIINASLEHNKEEIKWYSDWSIYVAYILEKYINA